MFDIKPNSKNRSRKNLPHKRSVKIKSSHAANPAPVLAGIDKPLLYVVIALALLGLTAVYSASANEAIDNYGNSFYFVQRQLIFFIAGIIAMFGVSKIPYFTWGKWAQIIALFVIGLLLYTLHSGVEAYGAERWIKIFGIQFQPSELGKISVVLLLTQALSGQNRSKKNITFVINIVLILITLLLTYKQPSLSMTIILFTVSLGMMFIAGIPSWMLLMICTGGGGYVGYKLLHTEYQLRRIQGWLDPWKDAQDTGYNLIQSLYAIGSGGILGTGIGMSHQKLYYLPFQYTDFIFAVWAEEWGLIGCLVLIGLFMTMLFRGWVIARTCRSQMGQLLAMGITMLLAFQIIINISVATGLFPVTGVTLPLISYGGTSALVTLVMAGILLNISRYRISVSKIDARQIA